MFPIGTMNVIKTKIKRGAINNKARSFSRLRALASDFFKGVPSAAYIEILSDCDIIFTRKIKGADCPF